jgi:hypothetical protein
MVGAGGRSELDDHRHYVPVGWMVAGVLTHHERGAGAHLDSHSFDALAFCYTIVTAEAQRDLHPQAAHRDLTDAGHDLALGACPRRNQPPATVAGPLSAWQLKSKAPATFGLNGRGRLIPVSSTFDNSSTPDQICTRILINAKVRFSFRP